MKSEGGLCQKLPVEESADLWKKFWNFPVVGYPVGALYMAPAVYAQCTKNPRSPSSQRKPPAPGESHMGDGKN